jgi:hypothetical protein
MNYRTGPQRRQDEVWELVEMIRQHHLKRNRRFTCRRAYDITADAVRIVWPKPPVAKPRGKKAKRS